MGKHMSNKSIMGRGKGGGRQDQKGIFKAMKRAGENDVTESKRNSISRRKDLPIKYRVKVKEEKNRKYPLHLRIDVIGTM